MGGRLKRKFQVTSGRTVGRSGQAGQSQRRPVGDRRALTRNGRGHKIIQLTQACLLTRRVSC